MSEHTPLSSVAPLKDRSVGLILFGILEVLIGGFWALMVPMIFLSATMPQPDGATYGLRMMIPAAAIYLLLAVGFVWIGIGSILARRWARALMLVISWLWLIMGITSTIFLAAIGPRMFDAISRQAPPGQQIPREAIPAMLAVMFSVLAGIYVVLPAIFVLFYRGRNVKATCEFRDPRPRWTDRCPLPVLALSLMLAVGAYSIVWMMPSGIVMPLFGVLVGGVPAMVVCAVFACLLGWLAWGTYRLRIGAWWGTLALMVLGGLSGVITFARRGLLEMYEKMDFPQQQIDMIRQMGITDKPFIVGSTVIAAAVWIGYLLFLRRYFVASASQRSAA
jgi:hypothetical protein